MKVLSSNSAYLNPFVLSHFSFSFCICYIVGRWMKPRMASYFLESCILCTPNQEKEADKFMTWLFEHQPQLFRTGIAKYLDANGITLPENSKFRQQVQKMNIPKVAPVASSLSRENSDSDDDSHEQEKESPLSPPSSSLTSQQPSKASRLADYETLNNDEEQETSKLSPQYHHQQQQQQLQILTSPNQRILQTNSRRHKFSQDSNSLRRKSATASSPTSLFGHINSNQKLVISPVDQEDDEAENDFEITTQP
jgi:hypothetical protein